MASADENKKLILGLYLVVAVFVIHHAMKWCEKEGFGGLSGKSGTLGGLTSGAHVRMQDSSQVMNDNTLVASDEWARKQGRLDNFLGHPEPPVYAHPMSAQRENMTDAESVLKKALAGA